MTQSRVWESHGTTPDYELLTNLICVLGSDDLAELNAEPVNMKTGKIFNNMMPYE